MKGSEIMQYPFIQCNSGNYKPGRSSPVKYIVIHYTSNNGDTAKGNAQYFARTALRASANYFVDENEIYLSVPEQDTAWHCGTSGTYKHPVCRNTNSLGIELCSRKDADEKYYFMDDTVSNALELTKSLMDKYSVPIENVIRHYDVTGKNCPAPFVENESKWENFKARLVGGDDEEVAQTRYNTIGEMPSWAQEPIQYLVDEGLLSKSSTMDLSLDMVRSLVVLSRLAKKCLN